MIQSVEWESIRTDVGFKWTRQIVSMDLGMTFIAERGQLAVPEIKLVKGFPVFMNMVTQRCWLSLAVLEAFLTKILVHFQIQL